MSPRAGRRSPALRSTSWPSIRTAGLSCSPLTATLMSPSVTDAPRRAAHPWATVPLWRRRHPIEMARDQKGRAKPSPPVPGGSAATGTAQGGLRYRLSRCPRPSSTPCAERRAMNMERSRAQRWLMRSPSGWRAERARGLRSRPAMPRPCVHEGNPPIEKVGPAVAVADLVRILMRQRPLRRVGIAGAGVVDPCAEGGAEPMRHRLPPVRVAPRSRSTFGAGLVHAADHRGKRHVGERRCHAWRRGRSASCP